MLLKLKLFVFLFITKQTNSNHNHNHKRMTETGIPICDFVFACQRGDLDIAKSLFEQHPTIDVSFNNEYAFRYACIDGKLNTAKWLLEIKPTINMYVNNQTLFQYTCANGHLPVAKWLLEIKPSIDISGNNDWAFRTACKNGHLEVAEWLVTLNPNKYRLHYNSTKFRYNYEIINPLNIIGTKKVSELEQCPICCVSVCDIITECDHSYCTNCITQWLNKNGTRHSCPTCRKNLKNTNFRKYIA